MTPAVTLRPATADDALALGVLGTQVFLDTYATGGIRPALAREVQASFSTAAMAAVLADAGTRVVVAERDSHLVGFVQMALHAPHALAPAGVQAEIVRLYVQEPFTGGGVGSALLAAAEALLRETGAAVAWLTPWVHNRRALAFYARRGYTDHGETVFRFEGESHANRLLAKPLADPYTLRSATAADAAALSALVHRSFLELAADGWSDDARAGLLDGTAPAALAESLASATHGAAAFDAAGAPVAFILLPRPTLVSLLFVHPQHLRRGLARRLWEGARTRLEARHPEVKTVELNATPYALPAYRRLGFVPLSATFERGGCRATRMACWLPARALHAELP